MDTRKSTAPDIATIVVETALDAYRDALLEAFTGLPGVVATVEAVRPSAGTVHALVRPRLPAPSLQPNRRERRAAAAAFRRGRP